MKIERITYYLEQFKNHLKAGNKIPDMHFEEVVLNWRNTWDIKSQDLANNYEQSLKSNISAELWGGSRNSAKSMMFLLIKQDQNFMRSAFIDLFDEKKDLSMRLQRFIHHCDEILNILNEKDKRINAHFHEDKKLVLMYLALQYPANYCFWDYPVFHNMMQKSGSLNIPGELETERYYKSMRAIFGIILKDNEFIELWEKYLINENIKAEPNLLFMNHYAYFVSKN